MENIRRTLKSHGERRGLGKAVAAGIVCQEAEKRMPGLFRAISLKDDVLHIEISKQNLLEFKLSEGKLLQELQEFAEARQLPIPARYRLTFPRESANL